MTKMFGYYDIDYALERFSKLEARPGHIFLYVSPDYLFNRYGNAMFAFHKYIKLREEYLGKKWMK